jgi:hypothetical protein
MDLLRLGLLMPEGGVVWGGDGQFLKCCIFHVKCNIESYVVPLFNSFLMGLDI